MKMKQYWILGTSSYGAKAVLIKLKTKIIKRSFMEIGISLITILVKLK